MIYFTMPVVSGVNSEEVDVYLDRNISSEYTLDLFTYEDGRTLSQVRPSGINYVEESVTLIKRNVPIELLLRLDKYFKYLNTRELLVNFPDGAKSLLVEDWSIVLVNALYGNFQVKAELMYL